MLSRCRIVAIIEAFKAADTVDSYNYIPGNFKGSCGRAWNPMRRLSLLKQALGRCKCLYVHRRLRLYIDYAIVDKFAGLECLPSQILSFASRSNTSSRCTHFQP